MDKTLKKIFIVKSRFSHKLHKWPFLFTDWPPNWNQAALHLHHFYMRGTWCVSLIDASHCFRPGESIDLSVQIGAILLCVSGRSRLTWHRITADCVLRYQPRVGRLLRLKWAYTRTKRGAVDWNCQKNRVKYQTGNAVIA